MQIGLLFCFFSVRGAMLRGRANRSFATSDHVVQNPPCWRASSLLFPHWDITTKRSERVKLAFVLMSQCGNNNELAFSIADFIPRDR